MKKSKEREGSGWVEGRRGMLERPLLTKPRVSFENWILQKSRTQGIPCVENYIQEGENSFQS